MKKTKIKTIASDYNAETGVSMVVISTDLGLFTGYAKLNPEDKEIESHYAGCRYAEIRAIIKYMEQKIRITNYKIKPLYEIYDSLSKNKKYKIVNKILEKKIYLLRDEISSYENNINTLEEKLKKAIDERIKMLNELKIKKQNN